MDDIEVQVKFHCLITSEYEKKKKKNQHIQIA